MARGRPAPRATITCVLARLACLHLSAGVLPQASDPLRVVRRRPPASSPRVRLRAGRRSSPRRAQSKEEQHEESLQTDRQHTSQSQGPPAAVHLRPRRRRPRRRTRGGGRTRPGRDGLACRRRRQGRAQDRLDGGGRQPQPVHRLDQQRLPDLRLRVPADGGPELGHEPARRGERHLQELGALGRPTRLDLHRERGPDLARRRADHRRGRRLHLQLHHRERDLRLHHLPRRRRPR